MHLTLSLGLLVASAGSAAVFAPPTATPDPGAGREALQEAGGPLEDDVPPALRAAVEEIQGQVESIRGLAFLRPVALRVASSEDLSRYLAERIEATTTPEELERLDLVAKLTGLLPAEEDLLATQLELIESQVGGFYDPATDTFSIMDGLVGGAIAKVILAHELTHALDDQHYDLDAELEARSGNADAAWAYQALVEGSATAVMNQWTVQQLLAEDGLKAGDFEEAGEMGADVLERMQPFLWKPLLGAYLRGSAFLARTDSVLRASMSSPPPADIDRAFRNPPRSSEQVLHPDTYWEEGQLDPPLRVTLHLDRFDDEGRFAPGEADALPDAVRAALSSARLLANDSFGELQLGFVVESPEDRKGLSGQMAVLGARYSSRAVEGWGGDRYALVGVGAARALIVRTRWDDEREAREFQRALEDDELAQHLDASLSALTRVRAAGEAQARIVSRAGDEVRFALAAGLDEESTQALLEALTRQTL